MAGKLYKGKDRRMLRKAYDVLAAIARRDLLALDLTKKTQALSNRVVIFDLTDAPTQTAINDVFTILTAKLAANAP